jgi:hypothetical protein
MLEGIVRAGEKQAIVYDKDQFALRTQKKDGHLLNLGNAYPEYCAAPRARRSENVKRWVTALKRKNPKAYKEIRQQLDHLQERLKAVGD